MIANFSDHAANERTFLAWVRTAVALVAFGLALARFDRTPPTPITEFALVALGGLVVGVAWLRMHLLYRHIEKSDSYPYTVGILGVFMALAVVGLGAMIVMFGLDIT